MLKRRSIENTCPLSPVCSRQRALFSASLNRGSGFQMRAQSASFRKALCGSRKAARDRLGRRECSLREPCYQHHFSCSLRQHVYCGENRLLRPVVVCYCARVSVRFSEALPPCSAAREGLVERRVVGRRSCHRAAPSARACSVAEVADRHASVPPWREPKRARAARLTTEGHGGEGPVRPDERRRQSPARRDGRVHLQDSARGRHARGAGRGHGVDGNGQPRYAAVRAFEKLRMVAAPCSEDSQRR